MKFTIVITLITFLSLGLAAPTVDDAALSKTALRKRGSSIIECDECREHRDMCFKYAMGDEHSGCDKVCTSYLCRKWPECEKCGEEFNCKDANLTMPPGWS